MKNTINLALQVLPRSASVDTYQLVDKAIEVIQKSGLKYRICPFETVIEGDYESVMKVVDQAQQACFDSGADELLVNIKIQRRNNADVTIEEKTAKYK
ncbi:MAG: MTH1187 family thiamine-binding protein [Cyclobacteriaceae bacterium]|nr:MTH1187 family thiamine-binding protein [Cyclobacteriaceae bacterium]